VRNIVGPREVSVAGTPGETGVILLYVPKTSDAAKAGLFAGDILLAFNGKPVKELQDLLKETRQVVAGTAVSATAVRYQQESTVMILLNPNIAVDYSRTDDHTHFRYFILDIRTYNYSLRSRGLLRLKPNEFVPSDRNRCP
jgi:C-terminal processing protease CtpA/Prc